MAAKKGTLPPALAAGIICLVVGGAGGYFARYWNEESRMASPPTEEVKRMKDPPVRPGAPVPVAAGGGLRAPAASPGGGQTGGAPGGGGGPGAELGESQRGLAMLVRGLSAIQAAQGKGLTPDQAAKVTPLLKQVREASKMPDADCKAKLDAIEQVLTPDQKQVLERLSRRRGGQRGAGGGPGAGPGGAPGGGPPASPDAMFKEGQTAQYLDELLKGAK